MTERMTRLGQVIERSWTTLAAQHEEWVEDPTTPRRRHGDKPAMRKVVTPQPELVGIVTLVRECAFAWRSEAEAWIAEQAREGFAPREGGDGLASFSSDINPDFRRNDWMNRNRGTDSQSNCWLASVVKVVS